LALCNLTLFAQTGTNWLEGAGLGTAGASQRPTAKALRVVRTDKKPATHVPPQEAPAALKKIYSNLGKSKTDLYTDNAGWYVAGPNAVDQPWEFIAMPFTPKSNSHVSQVQAALLYDSSGANQVNLSIYGDTGGAPGTLLAGPVTVTNLPTYPFCCTLAVANFSPVAVTAGAQYWVVADTPLTGQGSDFEGNWQFVVATILQGANVPPFGWYSFDVGPEQAAGEVLGTIP
jgi:hypothetical protein